MAPVRWFSWAVLGIAIAVSACAGGAKGGPPPAPVEASTDGRSPELARAIESWHVDDDLEPLRRWVRRHPGDPDVGVWREVVALHSYEACAQPTGGNDEGQLRSVAREYPETLAGRVAALTLVGDRLGALYSSVPGPLVADFLDGGDAWAKDGGGAAIVTTQLAAVHDVHSEPLRDAMARALLDDRCDATMGYCSWWVARYPNDARTAAIEDAITATWYRRGHPHWRGGKHARCAYRCMRECRERASALDDSCYAPCYARC